MSARRLAQIIIAEDDDDDFFLIKKTIETLSDCADLCRVHDGEELIELLRKKKEAARRNEIDFPGLVFLDINMPRKDGWETLREMKDDPDLRNVPVIVLTTSDIDDDKIQGYALGASSYFRKPANFVQWLEMFKQIDQSWLKTVK